MKGSVLWGVVAGQHQVVDPRCRFCGMPGKETIHTYWETDTPTLFDGPKTVKMFTCSDPRCGADDRWGHFQFQTNDLARNDYTMFYEERIPLSKSFFDTVALAT